MRVGTKNMKGMKRIKKEKKEAFCLFSFGWLDSNIFLDL